MHQRSKPKAWSILVALLTLFLVAPMALAKGGGKGSVQIMGFCVAKGKLFPATKLRCQQEKGTFFKDRKAAQAWQEAHVSGFCVLNGRVIAMKKGDCLKKRGKFFTDKKRATAWVHEQEKGFCCLEGRVVSMVKAECRKRRGSFARTQKEALKICDPMGWCLAQNMVTPMRKSACAVKKGRFFTNKAKADKEARALAAKRECERKKGSAAGIASPSVAKKIGKPAPAPFLKVERIFLEKGTIHVKLKNQGHGALSPELLHKGRLVMRVGIKSRTWALSQVDSRAGLAPGRSITFDSGIKIGKTTTVQVSFARIPGRGGSAVLTPPHPQFAKMAGKKPLGGKKTPALTPKPTMMNNKARPNGQRPRPVPFSLEHGIRILSPTSRAKFYAGETITVRYQVTDSTYRGNITFTVTDRGGRQAARVTVPQGTNQVSMTLRNDVTGTGFYVQARGSDTVYGESDPFEIHANSARVEFQEIDENLAFAGVMLPVNYRVSRRIAPGPITFELRLWGQRNGQPISTATAFYRPPLPEANLSLAYQTVKVKIPIERIATSSYNTARYRYVILAKIGAHGERGISISPSFHIRHGGARSETGGEGLQLSCSIVGGQTRFYMGDTMHIQASNSLRRGMVNRQLFFVPLDGSRNSRTKIKRIILNGSPDITSFEVPLTGIAPGNYRLRLVADVVSGEGGQNQVVHGTAESRPFVLLARPSSHEEPVLQVRLPQEGYRLPLDVNVPVSWDVVSGWEDGDRIVCRLRHGANELYTRTRWEPHGLIGMFNPRTSADSAGNYQVVVEHRRGDRVLNSVTRNFVWFFLATPHCSSSHPINIVEVHPRGDSSYRAGGTMHVEFCVVGSIENPHDITGVRVLLSRESTGQEWTVGEWHPGAPQRFDWPIPHAMDAASDYHLRIMEIGGSTVVRYPHAIEIEGP